MNNKNIWVATSYSHTLIYIANNFNMSCALPLQRNYVFIKSFFPSLEFFSSLLKNALSTSSTKYFHLISLTPFSSEPEYFE